MHFSVGPILTLALAGDFSTDALPVLQKYCASCHRADKASGEVTFHATKDDASAAKHPDLWERVLDNVRGGTMPPPGKAKPPAADVEKLAAWIEAFERKRHAAAKVDPGRPTLRRLNRAEYNNTIRDLLGVDVRPADDFPTDDSGYGFDNIGDVLTLPPILMEKYLTAAENAVEAAFTPPQEKVGPELQRRFQGRELIANNELFTPSKPPRRMVTNGELFVNVQVPETGDYVLKARAFQEKAGDEDAKLEFRVDEHGRGTHVIKALQARPTTVQSTVNIEKGHRRIGVAFVNDFYDKNQKDPKKRDRNLAIVHIEIEGPVGVRKKAEPTAAYKRIMVAQPNGSNDDAAASRILRTFARRAYRRIPTNAEVDRLASVYKAARKAGDDFETAVKTGLQAALVSPHFLYRVERDKPTDGADGVRDLDDYELASRLSYFLWSSMPDDELFAQAAKGKLQDETVLKAQVERMLKDEKAWAFVENFAGQWLQTRMLREVTPDVGVYKTWDEPLRAAMIEETEMFFDAMIAENRPIVDFLAADFTFVNDRLARHYGIKNIRGKKFQRVQTTGTMRGGLLTQASFLTLTSNPNRTSPVKRGKWILENILNSPPPPPPPGAGDLDDEKRPLTGSLRQKLEQHRANPTCNSCHQRMDPLGLAFENFDGIGAFRTHDGKHRIDPSGTLPTGERIGDADELKKVLKSRLEQFRRCLAEKLFVYAMGRGAEKSDRPALERICKNSAAAGDKFPTMIWEVVKSDAFRKRKNQGSGT